MASTVENGKTVNGQTVDVTNDPKYKKYALAVERCLTTFENVHEWADFISFLTKLLKTFQTYMQFKEIPRKLLVAKRLSQCLNPALPNGVHQRTLDVYSHILAVIGPDSLRRDLALWSSGLFPFFEYAATSVKPTLLNLYDTHYIPLHQGLRPVMKAFILALLPGVEEETGEFFDKVLSILDKLSKAVTPAFFFQNMWLILMTSPAARSPAINYLARRMPKPSPNEDLVKLLGGDVGLVMRSFATALEDEHLLVKRGVLDLINQSLRLDGPVLQNATPEDRSILMNASVAVVLRRDVSLNRRVNTWLLGSLDDTTDGRVAYFKKYSLQLLASTLRSSMVSSSPTLRTTRPYKIFISLLDTWEIGSPLTEEIVLDALGAIDVSSLSNNSGAADSDDEMVVAATSVFERAEPRLIWKHILASTLDSFKTGDLSMKVANTLRLVFLAIRNHDEESQTVHIPLFITNVLVALTSYLQRTDIDHTQTWLSDLLAIIPPALQATPSAAILKWQEIASEESLSSSPAHRAKQVYDLSGAITTNSMPDDVTTPLDVSWRSLTEASQRAVSIGLERVDGFENASQLLVSLVSVLNALERRVKDRIDSATHLSWQGVEWTSAMLKCLASNPPFELVDEIVTSMVALTQIPSLRPPFSFGDRNVQKRVLKPLLHYLSPNQPAFHPRVVQLFWLLHSSSLPHQLEALVTQSLSVSGSSISASAVEQFGVLWRFSDDNSLPGFEMRMPLLAVLDALRSDNPASRRVGETWMRSSLKSYLRVLDPIIYDLVSACPIRTPYSAAYQGRTVRGYHYVRPFDQKMVHYILECLLAVVRFGGQGFVRVARSTPLSRTPHPTLFSVTHAAKLAESSSSYLDVLMEILHLFLQSEPSPTLSSNMLSNNLQIQGTVLELLQGIIARGELDQAILETAESILVGRLYVSVHSSRLDLQHKLLHVLHSVIFAASSAPSTHRSSRRDSDTSHRASTNPLFVQMLVDGISRLSNRPVLQHWIDFILMTVGNFRSLSHAVSPLCDCVCRQLRLSFTEVNSVITQVGKGKAPIRWTASDSDILSLLGALERLVLLGLSKAEEVGVHEEEQTTSERLPAESSTGILGYVFGSEAPQRPDDEQIMARSPTFKNLQEAVRTVHSLWAVLGGLPESDSLPYRLALASVAERVRARCMKTMEHLLKLQSTEVLESLIECWLLPTVAQSTVSFKASAIEAIDALTSSAQLVIQMVCGSVAARVIPSVRSKRPNHIVTLSDSDLFAFMEAYFRRLEGPIAVQVWPTFAALAKELSAGQEYRNQMLPLLKCTTVLCDKLTTTTAFEDRKSRKDLQDTFTKLLDNCILISGRSFEQGNWLRKGAKDKETITSGRASPVPPDSDTDRDEKATVVGSSLDVSKNGGLDVIELINRFLASECIPLIKRILVDNDKVASVCSNIVYYIINPGLKTRSSKINTADDVVMDILAELTRITPASKAWKPVISDAFNDNRFFNSPPSSNAKWKPLIKGLMDIDKQTINDLLSKMAAAPSANIFTSRETEMLLRSLNLRRLSYAVFTGERNQFLTQLPIIQERLVDILRPGAVAPIVHSEVYLCMRVLLCRLSPHNLSSFWPVIITELYRVFQQMMITPPADKSDDLQLVLAACKFLDLLVVLQTDEFQVYQWMFITDTFDAVYRADDSKPTSLMDLLTDTTSAIPNTTNATTKTLLPEADWRDTSLQRPMLRTVRSITSVKDLVPFFSRISLHAYESIYSGGLVDWDAVELGLLEDLFDGW